MVNNFLEQFNALREAATIIRQLPTTAVWAVCATNDDDPEHPTVLNIFIRDTTCQEYLAMLPFKLKTPWDTGAGFVSYRKGSLLISIIEEGTDDRRDTGDTPE